MKTITEVFYNRETEHSYVWSDAENEWIGFPTYLDGEPDWLNPILFSNIRFKDNASKNKLKTWLMYLE